LVGVQEPGAHSLEKRKLINPLIGTVLFITLYFPVLVPLVHQWIADPNYRHGMLVPIISGFIIFRRRRVLEKTRGGGGETTGFLIMMLSAVLLIGGTAAAEFFTSRFSLPLFLIGASLYIRGKNFTKKAAFPLLFLFLMIPLPYIIYFKITSPLQLMSAKLSAGILHAIHITAIRKGNTILLPNYTLDVVAACSGLRSMMTMFTLALILSAFSTFTVSKKIILVACAVPIAIVANTFRLVVTATGAYISGPELAEGVLHHISGLIVFLAGFILLIVTAGILKWIK